MSFKEHVLKRMRELEAESAERNRKLDRRVISSHIDVMRGWLERADAPLVARNHLDGVIVRLESGEFDNLTLNQFQNKVHPEFNEFGLRFNDCRQQDREALKECASALNRI